MHPYSIYIHIPFCRHRCAYCDFNTYAGQDALIPAYVEALCHEVKIVARLAGMKIPVFTIYFGGGTPSLLSAENIAQILDVLDSNFLFSKDMEITLEANPGTVSLHLIRGLRSCGVNRLSLGMQSSNPHELQLLERQHDYFDLIHSIAWARQAGFENINMDLIYGLPEQELTSWLASLNRAIDLAPTHLSLYALSIEPGTPMHHWIERGLLEEPDADLAADMYEASSAILADSGYIQYEISNWASQSINGELLTCKHNLQYWHNLPYLGFGAGAHGYNGAVRIANILSPSKYIDRITQHVSTTGLLFPQSPATSDMCTIDKKMEMAETMMMGMRLVMEGVSAKSFVERFDVELQDAYPDEIPKLQKMGLVEWVGDNSDVFRLTAKGRLLGNIVFREFL